MIANAGSSSGGCENFSLRERERPQVRHIACAATASEPEVRHTSGLHVLRSAAPYKTGRTETSRRTAILPAVNAWRTTEQVLHADAQPT
jgi:hypothetical protein